MTGKRQEVKQQVLEGFPHKELENLQGKRQRGFGDFTFCYIILFFPADLLNHNKVYQTYE